MHVLSQAIPLRITLALSAILIVANGCSRTRYRREADCEAYQTIAERNVDPRWRAPDYSIEMDPRSRYFDPYNPDCSPMPKDDPASHRYMVCVDGMKGWKHWYDHGSRSKLENPGWAQAMAGYVDTAEDGTVKLDVDNALRLAYMHSPTHQSQLETLYLSALDVTAERFRLDTQFFGGYDANYVHQGALIPSRITYNPTLGRYLVTPSIDGTESNLLTAGRPTAGNPALQARRRFATAGELIVGFANSFVFEFTGGDANLAASLANFSLVQPLLRGAGKDVALEQLTFVERNLLANLRAYSQFRQGLFTEVAIGDLGVTGPQRSSRNTRLTSYSGTGNAGGFLGLLRQRQVIRNTDDNLSLQERTLARLAALEDVGIIDLIQVDQFRQNLEQTKSELLASLNAYELTLDNYKTNTLGLPPDLPVELDESLIEQFQLIPRESTEVLNSLVDLQERLGELPDEPTVKDIDRFAQEAEPLVEDVRAGFADIEKDLARMEQVVPQREETMNRQDRDEFRTDREKLAKRYGDLQREFELAATELVEIQNELSDESRQATARHLISWVARFLRIVERLALVPARARLESIIVEPIDLSPDTAFAIALDNRLDFMNGRAALVDSWRQIQVNADALQSVLDVTAGGDMRTARNNPLSFRAPTGTFRAGLEFDAPFTRLLERNAYRESLINYQRDRRAYIQSRDRLHLGLRALVRQVDQYRRDLEIQRRAVAIAIRQVDLTQAALAAPVRPPQPGQRMLQFTSTTAFNLLSAQSSLVGTQNRFLSVWLNYYATRMRLAREMGVMQLDGEGRWVDLPLPGTDSDGKPDTGAPELEELPVPPMIPAGWIALASHIQRLPTGEDSLDDEPIYVPPPGRRPAEPGNLPRGPEPKPLSRSQSAWTPAAVPSPRE